MLARKPKITSPHAKVASTGGLSNFCTLCVPSKDRSIIVIHSGGRANQNSTVPTTDHIPDIWTRWWWEWHSTSTQSELYCFVFQVNDYLDCIHKNLFVQWFSWPDPQETNRNPRFYLFVSVDTETHLLSSTMGAALSYYTTMLANSLCGGSSRKLIAGWWYVVCALQRNGPANGLQQWHLLITFSFFILLRIKGIPFWPLQGLWC